MIYKYCVIGCGATGSFILASLPKSELSQTILISPEIGGDLLYSYGEVTANLTKSQLITSMKKISSWSSNSFEILDKYKDDECPKLSDLALQVLTYTKPLLKEIGEFVQTKLNFLENNSDCYSLHTNFGIYKSKKVILCNGANNKQLDFPIPSIPFQVALTPNLLKAVVKPTDRIALFGTSHSGTLIMKNLKDLEVEHVTAFYNTEKPFYYARDGFSEGIKHESAKIADEISAKSWKHTPELVNTINTSKLFKELNKADYVIYAIGFEPRNNFKTNFDLKFNHDELTFETQPNLFGFGIGYPSYYVGTGEKKFFNVGYDGFIDAIQKKLPNILE